LDDWIMRGVAPLAVPQMQLLQPQITDRYAC